LTSNIFAFVRLTSNDTSAVMKRLRFQAFGFQRKVSVLVRLARRPAPAAVVALRLAILMPEKMIREEDSGQLKEEK
jgi:hypothetical protein